MEKYIVSKNMENIYSFKNMEKYTVSKNIAPSFGTANSYTTEKYSVFAT